LIYWALWLGAAAPEEESPQLRRGVTPAHHISTFDLPDLTYEDARAGATKSVPEPLPTSELPPGTEPINTSIGVTFDGLAQSGFIPADPNIAVGTLDVVQTVNKRFRIFSRTGVTEFTQNLTGIGLWSGLGVTGTLFSPRCRRDPLSGRFLITMLETVDTTDSFILLAISDNSDPVGTWFTYRASARTNVIGTQYGLSDAAIAVDATAVYVSGTLTDLATGTQTAGILHRMYNKTPLLTGAAANFLDIRDAAGVAVYPAQSVGSPAAQYFASTSGLTQIRLSSIRNPTTLPILTHTVVNVSSFTLPNATVPNLTSSGGCGLAALDGRIQTAGWRGGQLIAAHTVRSGSENVVRWYQFNVNSWPTSGAPTLAMSGTVDPGGTLQAWMPAIAQNGCNQLGLVVSRASATDAQGIYVTGRNASDAAGNMFPLTSVFLSSSAYCPTSNLFGACFDLTVDPVDDFTFWCVGQWASGVNTWQTRITSFQPDLCCTPPTIGDIPSAILLCGSQYTSPAPVMSGTPPFTFALAQAPPGMANVNESTGVVTWANPIPAASPYIIGISATNTCGTKFRYWSLTVKPGDFTGDGLVTSADLPIFVQHLLNQSSARPCAADVDLNGVVDGRDVQSFVRCLFGPACP